MLIPFEVQFLKVFIFWFSSAVLQEWSDGPLQTLQIVRIGDFCHELEKGIIIRTLWNNRFDHEQLPVELGGIVQLAPGF